MRKLKFFIDYGKEEKWLNYMAKQGYELIDSTFGYKFKAVKPQKSNIRIDYRTFKKNNDFIDYCTMFEDSGWKHIAGNKWSGTQYFKKIRQGGSDDIFSDSSSKAGRYKRLANMWLTLAITYLPIMLVLISSGSIDVNAMLNPKLLYYTPGLWQMSGSEFWSAFLFETPFALLRGFSWMLFPLIVVLYISFGLKAQLLYNNSK